MSHRISWLATQGLSGLGEAKRAWFILYKGESHYCDIEHDLLLRNPGFRLSIQPLRGRGGVNWIDVSCLSEFDINTEWITGVAGRLYAIHTHIRSQKIDRARFNVSTNTVYRLYGRRFYRSKDPPDSIKVLSLSLSFRLWIP